MFEQSRLLCGVGIFAFALLSSAAIAHTPEQPPHQAFPEGDLKLESGEVIKDFSISYVTHGNLNEKKNNAILVTSSIGGNHHQIDFLIGPGKALDTNKYFIIATDAISNGCRLRPATARPSMGLRSRFSPFATWSNRNIAWSEKNLASRIC